MSSFYDESSAAESVFESATAGGGGAPKIEVVSSTLEEVDETRFQFFPIECILESLNSSERKEMLLQWNVDACLSVKRFRFAGHLLQSSSQDYLTLVKEVGYLFDIIAVLFQQYYYYYYYHYFCYCCYYYCVVLLLLSSTVSL